METLGIILGILGLFGMAQIVSFFNETIGRWWILQTWSPERVQKEVGKLLRESIVEFRQPTNVASFGDPVLLRYYIDFMSTVTNSKQKSLLDRCAIRWIKLSYPTLPDKIAVPKLGNVILGESVATRLGLPLVIVRQDERLFIKGGHSLEGKLAAGERVLILDDVASDAEFLARCVDQLRAFQATVLGVLCIVNRPEGSVKAALNSAAVPFEFIVELADRELEELAHSKI